LVLHFFLLRQLLFAVSPSALTVPRDSTHSDWLAWLCVCAASITASALVVDNDDKEGESENENNKFASFASHCPSSLSSPSHVLRAALLLLGLLRCAEGAC
jgi:hypothetical protein